MVRQQFLMDAYRYFMRALELTRVRKLRLRAWLCTVFLQMNSMEEVVNTMEEVKAIVAVEQEPPSAALIQAAPVPAEKPAVGCLPVSNAPH